MNPCLRRSVALAAGASVALTLGACSRGQQGGWQMPPSVVQSAKAVRMDTPNLVAAFGTTEERESVDIVPQVSGVLLRALVADGAVVTNGQPLFQIDPRDYASRVKQVEAALAADRAAVELSRNTLQRNEAMLAKKLISQQDYDTLRMKLDAAQAQLGADEAALEVARLNLERCTVSAPIAGVCAKRYVDEGNLVGAGQSRLTNIRSYDPMSVEFAVSEQYLGLLRGAMAQGPVRIDIVPRGDTNTYSGSVTFIDNAVNPLSGTIMLRGEVPNAGLKLWARQFVDVHIYAGTLRDAVMVPEGAVQLGKQGPYAYVVGADSKVELRPVKTGARYHDLIQIVEGVAPGDNAVVLGQFMLYPGAAVKDTSQQPAAEDAPAATGAVTHASGKGGAGDK